MKRFSLKISKMTCGSCAISIEKALNTLDGVESAQVNFALERATGFVDETKLTKGQLVDVVKSLGYDATTIENDIVIPIPNRQDVTALERINVVSAIFLAASSFLLSMFSDLSNDVALSLLFAISTVVMFGNGLPIHRATLRSFPKTQMDTLVTLGTLAAFTYSTIAMFQSNANGYYFEVSSVVIAAVLFGRILERTARFKSTEIIRQLARQKNRDVTLLDQSGRQSTISLNSVKPGQVLLVRPGEKIPVNGVVVNGESEIDNSIITGESVPVEVTVNDQVIGGSLNTFGALEILAKTAGAYSAEAQIEEIVLKALSEKSKTQRLTDRVSSVVVPVTLFIALATAVAWFVLTGQLSNGVLAAVSTLVVACPCALGLAIPTVVSVASGRAAKKGIYYAGSTVLEAAAKADVVIFDKTGTLTKAQMKIDEVFSLKDVTAEKILLIAGSLESKSEHPLGKAIANELEGDTLVVKEFVSEKGLGVTGIVDGVRSTVGRITYLMDKGYVAGPRVLNKIKEMQQRGLTCVTVGLNGELIGIIGLTDALKNSSQLAVRNLKERGHQIELLTGDSSAVGKRVAEQVGIDSVHSELLPEEKSEHISTLQKSDLIVAMVGDGVNDALALTKADIGISLGAGSNVADAASDVTISSGDPLLVFDALRISEKAGRIMRQNLFWAFFYNLIALPIAAFGLLNPMIGGIAMAMSSVFVVMNSLRMR